MPHGYKMNCRSLVYLSQHCCASPLEQTPSLANAGETGPKRVLLVPAPERLHWKEGKAGYAVKVGFECLC